MRCSTARKLPLLALSIATAVLVLGCANGVTTTQHLGPSSEGVSYFLPTNNVRIVFTNANIASEIAAATSAVATAKKTQAAANKTHEQAKRALKAADPKNPDEVKALTKAVSDAKKALDAAIKKRSKAEKVLTEKQAKREQILIQVLPPVPDTSQLYVANLDHGVLFDDSVTVKTSAEGMLTHVTYKASDKSAEVVQNLVETAIEGAKLYARLHGIPVPPTAVEQAEILKAGACTPAKAPGEYYWEFTLDPSDAEAVAAVNRKLLDTPLPFLVNIDAPSASFSGPPTLSQAAPGLLYRRPLPYTVEILEDRGQKEAICRAAKHVDNPGDPDPPLSVQIARVKAALAAASPGIPTSKSQQVLMLAGGPVALLEFGARPFVTSDLQATFKQGVLLDSKETRPSEAAGLSRIPLDMVRAVGDSVASVVSNLVQFKIDTTTKSKELIEAETDLLKAEQANAELQRQILDELESGDQEQSE